MQVFPPPPPPPVCSRHSSAESSAIGQPTAGVRLDAQSWMQAPPESYQDKHSPVRALSGPSSGSFDEPMQAQVEQPGAKLDPVALPSRGDTCDPAEHDVSSPRLTRLPEEVQGTDAESPERPRPRLTSAAMTEVSSGSYDLPESNLFAGRQLSSSSTMSRDEVPLSVGSLGHPSFCVAGCKFFAKGHCKDGLLCDRCHLCPWSRRVDRKLQKMRRQAFNALAQPAGNQSGVVTQGCFRNGFQ